MAAQHIPTPPSPRHTQVFIPGNTRSSNHTAPAVAQNIPQNIPAKPLLQATDFFTSDAKESLVGKCLDNRYDIISHLASGGMSEIYLASQRGIGQQVIIKKLHPHLYQDQNAVQRFIDEARTYAALTHPNAVKMYDLLNVNGQICIVMEYVAGKTLESYLESGYVFSVRQILDIAMQLSDALGTVHKAGIIHRDLKSENIMLMETVGERFSVKILDFGIAKITTNAQSNLTQEGAIVGTPKYMSPEQGCGRKDIDARTDIYSFGVIMFEMLCGHLPFEGESSLAILHQQIYAEVPGMSRPDASEIPEELQNLVLKCLKKDVNERYGSFSEIVHELTEIQENRSIAALTAIPKMDDNINFANTSENDVLDPALLSLGIEATTESPKLPAPAQPPAAKESKPNTDVSKPVTPQASGHSVSTPKTLETIQMAPYTYNPKKKSSFWLKAVIALLLLIIGGMVFIVMNDPKLKSGFIAEEVSNVPTLQPAPETGSEPEPQAADTNDDSESADAEEDNDDFNFDLTDEADTSAANDTHKKDQNAANDNKKEQNKKTQQPAPVQNPRPQMAAAASPKENRPVEQPVPAPKAPTPSSPQNPSGLNPESDAIIQQIAAATKSHPVEDIQPVAAANPQAAEATQTGAAAANPQPAVAAQTGTAAANPQPAAAAQTGATAANNEPKPAESTLEEGNDKSNAQQANETPKNPAQLTIGDIKVEFSFLTDFSDQSLRPHIHQVLGQAQDCRWLGNTGLQFIFTNKGAGSFARFQRRFSGSADPCLIKAFESYMRFPALENESTTVKIVIQRK